MNKRVPVLAVTALLVAAALVGCSQPKPTALGKPSQPYTTSQIADLKEHAPFRINVPGYLPRGYAFTSGAVTPDPKGNTLNTKVVMTFTADGKPSIRVTETRERPATQVDSEDHRGDGTVARSISVIDPSLTYTVDAVDVPREELLEIVKSLLQ